MAYPFSLVCRSDERARLSVRPDGLSMACPLLSEVAKTAQLLRFSLVLPSSFLFLPSRQAQRPRVQNYKSRREIFS